ncbi:condensation domain-containing protein, partial [Mucilaginibacter sp. RCC_168]|uniref:condensation domain-containing protein n=1 Tax=Mucilaginibacter sp. RCC_168 TaxID=3239221 RepID=UPI0035254F74
AAIWTDLLAVERVGIHDNFFQLGGDSIITIQVVSRLRHAGYHTRPRDIFMHQTIAALAAAIAAQDNTDITAEQGALTGKSGLLPTQQWYLSRQKGHLSHYNQSVLLAIDKSIAVELLQQAVQLLAERHDALRFRYEQTSSGWEQHYSSGPVLPLIVENMTTDTVLFGLRIRDISNDYQRGLDIEKGELIRVVLMKTLNDQSHNRLLIVIHHLVVDGVSWRILLEDLGLIISALMQGNSPVWGNKSSSYRDWYNALTEYGKSTRLLAQQPYWHKAVQRYRPLPYDHACSGPVKIKDTGHYRSRLSTAQTQVLLQDVPAVYHTEINDILLAALAKTIEEWSGSEEIVIGLEGHGREDILDGIDLSHTVGWFTSMYPVLLSKGTGTGPADWIKSVKEQLRKVPDKGLGYGILKYINKEPQLQGDLPWDIVFNYLGQLDNVLKQNQDNYLTAAGEPTGEQANPELLTDEKLSVNSMVAGGELVLNWGYSTLHFSQERIQELADCYLKNLETLIDHCTEQHKSGIVFTPSDYGLGNEIAYNELDSFLTENTTTGHGTIAGLYRLSDLQQGMLFHALYEHGSGAYVE